MAHDDASLAEILAHHRAAGFVGREDQLRALDSLLDTETTLRVLLVTGVSGVGKTTLLHGFQRVAQDRALSCTLVDTRDLPASSAQLHQALHERVPTGHPSLLLIDTFERIETEERWLREHLLPELPEGVRVVIAGRWTPATPWTTDPGWAALSRIEALADFGSEETIDYARRQGLNRATGERIHAFTRGHPLAVALATTLILEDPDHPLTLETSPGLVQALVNEQLESAPSEAARRTLYATGIARNLTEELLAAILGHDDTRALFTWLREQSFMRTGPEGLQPHELVGDALREHLKWREPGLHRDMIRRATRFLIRRVQEQPSESAFHDYVFTMRELGPLREMMVIEQDTGLYTDAPRPEEQEELADLVEYHQGPRARSWFAFWAARQPDGIEVLRDPDERITGFNFLLDVSAPDAD